MIKDKGQVAFRNKTPKCNEAKFSLVNVEVSGESNKTQTSQRAWRRTM